ncbi:MAG: response regulator transcription factor [Myxococcales bacterium]|nr:response regulator transcription factor [Myxococcales bacterium]
MTRVFIVDDHAALRRVVRETLGDFGLTVVGEAASGGQALADAALGDADVLVLDLAMDGLSGFEVLRRAGAAWPGLVVVVHSMLPREQYEARVLAAGAASFVSKGGAPRALVDAIHAAAAIHR